MSLLVLKPGLLDTIQDQGRFGHAQEGINPAGAMDTAALAVANFLVGNPGDMAALELHFPGPSLRFETPTLFALSGGDFSAQLDGNSIPMQAPVLAGAGSTLTFVKAQTGVRGYLAVQGGFELEPWLGSQSTNLVAGAGGSEGRALKADDILNFAGKTNPPNMDGQQHFQVLPWKVDTDWLYPAEQPLRFIPGPEYELLDAESKDFFEQSDWLITPQSDRMGYLMRGPVLQLTKAEELVSAAVVPGTIQLLPSGNFIILMADCQTTGGYPRIGQIIQADMPRLAQLPPGQRLQLQQVSLDAAFKAQQEVDQRLRKLQWSCTLRLKDL